MPLPTSVLVIEIGWGPDITAIGGLLLTWHGLFTALGILAGVWLGLRMARVVGYDEDDAYTLALVTVPSGIVGARLLFVWESGQWSPGEIIAIAEGGISVWGAILGGVAGGVAFAAWKRWPITNVLDAAGFGIILGQAIGRLGDLVNGEHLANATDLPWGVIYTNPDSPAFAHSLVVLAHHPATTYELLGDLVILGLLFVVLYRIFPRRPGLTFFAYLVGYAVMRFFLTYLRVDSAESLLGLRVPQVVSLAVVLASLPAIWYLARRPPLEPAPPDEPEPPRRRGRRVPVR